MRLFVLTLLLCKVSLTAFAAADSFEIVQNGSTYLCTNQGPSGSNGSSTVDCVNKAYAGPFSKDQSIRLCTGARSDAPATCAIQAYAGPLSLEESINLCVRAYSNAPINCFSKLYAGPFSKDESIRACLGGDEATADCVLRAYAGPYSKEESIQLCASNPRLLSLSLAKLHNEKALGFAQVIEKANQKALSRNEFRVNKVKLNIESNPALPQQ